MAIKLVAVEAHCFRVPIKVPLVTSFGIMHNRPAVFVRVVDADGTEGWGEAWCNWPAVGAEHRARLVAEHIGPRLIGRTIETPEAAFRALDRELEVLSIQTAEVGPLAQALAGIDQAVWDLHARKVELPLYRALGGAAVSSVPAYASGLNPDKPERLAAERQKDGHRAFKLKIGFGQEQDLRNIKALRGTLGLDAALMVDANQAYDFATACEMAERIGGFDLGWYEEPMRVDVPMADWQKLARKSPVPLAGGENLRGKDFEVWHDAGVLGVVQPDISKWGGISGNLAVGRQAVAANKRFCPHWLAAGVGLMASMHLLAAVGGSGLMEFDANPNPLRELVGGDLFKIREGRIAVPQTSGLGLVPDLKALRSYQTWPAGK